MHGTATRRRLISLLIALLIVTESAALAQFGGIGLPLGGGDDAAEAGEDAGATGGPGCADMDFATMPPIARKVAGEAAQAGNSTFIMMTRGRDILGRSMEETGDVDQALRVIRDEAAFQSLECGSDPYYRMGVCFNFTIQCVLHGGGGCDSCGRHWGNLFCKETLKKAKDEIPDIEDLFEEGEEWAQLVSLAEEVDGSTLVGDLDKFKDDVVSGAIDGPIDELCDSYFYGAT
ncbi:MAG: hypothetical protein WD273_06380 [Trueperaceae bacterium]